MQPCTLLTVPTSGSLPPVADHGLCAGLVHPVMAAGHIGAGVTRGSGLGRARHSQQFPSPHRWDLMPGPTYLSSLGLAADQCLPTVCPCSAAPPPTGLAGSRPLKTTTQSPYWKEGGRESPMPPVRSRGGGRSV